MNVFVLGTGRCGSLTFARACGHIANYTSGHESRAGMLGPARLAYPADHVESDNRLAWFLGRLDREFPSDVFYVHLRRDRLAVARSYAVRLQAGMIIPAYARGIYLGLPESAAPLDVALDYVDTVTANIELFLRDRSNSMTLAIESAKQDFPAFWQHIGAAGDLAGALAEFDTAYNAGKPGIGDAPPKGR
jgi:hypothetical protein